MSSTVDGETGQGRKAALGGGLLLTPSTLSHAGRSSCVWPELVTGATQWPAFLFEHVGSLSWARMGCGCSGGGAAHEAGTVPQAATAVRGEAGTGERRAAERPV